MKYLLLILILNFLFAKEILITSQIVDSNNTPLEKASIQCEDRYSLSDNKGFFSIKCYDSSLIKISYIGYKTFNEKASSIKKYIVLKTDNIRTEEIKVYGGLNENNNDTRIKVVSNDKFSLNGKNHLQDVIMSTPELNFSGGTSRPKYLQIRGLGELSQFSGEGAPHFYVGVFLDDINFTGIGGIALLDYIKQIEIFKGPQSTSFGSNAMAGAINLISVNPSPIKSYKFKLTSGSYNSNKISFNINYPISKRIFVNTTHTINKSDGYVKNRYLDDQNSNEIDETLSKIKLLFKYNENIQSLLTHYYIKLNNEYDAWTIDNNGFNTQSDFQGKDIHKTDATSLKTIFRLNKFKITSISSYSLNNLVYTYDGDWGNTNLWESAPYNWDPLTGYYEWNFPDVTYRKKKIVNQEIRVNYKNTLIGIYGSKIKESDERIGYFFSGDWDDMKSIFHINNFALFIKQNYKISEKYILNTSLRYDTYDTENDLYYRSTYYGGNYVSEKLKTNDDNIGWNINIENKVSKNSNIFLSFSKGYKTSGINQSPNFTNYRYYDSEESINTELGLNYKNSMLKINCSIFYMHRENPQLRLFVQNNVNYPTYFDYATFNGSQSYLKGIESNLEFYVNENHTIYYSISILDNYLGSFYFDENNDGINEKFGDREGAHSPKVSSTFATKTKINKNLSFNLDFNFNDSFYFDEQNDHKSNTYMLANSSIIYSYKNINISIWGKNLTNEKYPIRGYSFVLEPPTTTGYSGNKKDYVSYGEKRTSGITIEYKF